MKINKPKEMDLREANEYAQYLKANYHRTLKSLTIKIAEDDPNDVELYYEFEPIKFERIRRITGYLVGSLDSWNDGKRAEESDRVKHETEMETI